MPEKGKRINALSVLGHDEKNLNGIIERAVRYERARYVARDIGNF